MAHLSNTFTWQARPVDEGSWWAGKRRFFCKDLISSYSVRTKLLERLDLEEIQCRESILSDACAEIPTPWIWLVLTNGLAAKQLVEKLSEKCEVWNSEDKQRGLFWSAMVFGVEVYSNCCIGLLRGEQPEFWIRCDYLPNRQWKANLELLREKGAEDTQNSVEDKTLEEQIEN
jgi:hypothetical protein